MNKLKLIEQIERTFVARPLSDQHRIDRLSMGSRAFNSFQEELFSGHLPPGKLNFFYPAGQSQEEKLMVFEHDASLSEDEILFIAIEKTLFSFSALKKKEEKVKKSEENA